MREPLRWGILSTGNVAGQFAHDVNHARRSQLWAVDSRRMETAIDFALRHCVKVAFGRYEQVLANTEVEAVYIALPNALHQ